MIPFPGHPALSMPRLGGGRRPPPGAAGGNSVPAGTEPGLVPYSALQERSRSRVQALLGLQGHEVRHRGVRGGARRSHPRPTAPARAPRGDHRFGGPVGQPPAGRVPQGGRVDGGAGHPVPDPRAGARELPARAPHLEERPALLPRRGLGPRATGAHRDRSARAAHRAVVPARPGPARDRPACHERRGRRRHAGGIQARRRGAPARSRPSAHPGPREGAHDPRGALGRRRHRPAPLPLQEARSPALHRPPRPSRVVPGRRAGGRGRAGARERKQLARARPDQDPLAVHRPLHGRGLLGLAHPPGHRLHERGGGGRRRVFRLRGDPQRAQAPGLARDPRARARRAPGRRRGPGLPLLPRVQLRRRADDVVRPLGHRRGGRRLRRPVLQPRLRLHRPGQQLRDAGHPRGPGDGERRGRRPARPVVPPPLRRVGGDLPWHDARLRQPPG